MLDKGSRHGLKGEVRGAGIKPYFRACRSDQPDLSVHDLEANNIVVASRFRGYIQRIKCRPRNKHVVSDVRKREIPLIGPGAIEQEVGVEIIDRVRPKEIRGGYGPERIVGQTNGVPGG
jgi:hypothetical protein